METIIRDVRDMDNDNRQVIEHVVGRSLQDNQRLVIQIVNLDAASAEPDAQPIAEASKLPDWCNVYEGLTDAEIAELEQAVLTRADLTRSWK